MKNPEDSKTYRRLHKRVVKAAAARERKLDSGKLSVPSGLGRLSIIVSSRATWPTMMDEDRVREEHQDRLEEAERLREERIGQFAEIVIRPRAFIRDLKMDFANPDVSDICLIGHGTINGLLTNSNGKYFSWEDAARSAGHLKQGRIEQRMCGTFPTDLRYPVALGTFAVSHVSNVIAAVGVAVELPGGKSRDHLFTPIYNEEEHIIDQIERLNERHHNPVLAEAR